MLRPSFVMTVIVPVEAVGSSGVESAARARAQSHSRLTSSSSADAMGECDAAFEPSGLISAPQGFINHSPLSTSGRGRGAAGKRRACFTPMDMDDDLSLIHI